jgi:hypothetical protein
MHNKKQKKYISRRASSQRRNIFPSKRLCVGDPRQTIGVGYIIIPHDIDRDDYIKYVYQTGECMVITNTGEVIKDAKIPDHVIKEVTFPMDSNERGSLIYWNNVPYLNQVIVSGILFSPGKMYAYTEDVKVREHTNKEEENSFTEAWDSKRTRLTWDVYSPSGEEKKDSSGIKLRGRSPQYVSEVSLGLNGIGELYGDNVAQLRSEEEVLLRVGSSESEEYTEVSEFKIDRSGILSYLDRYENNIQVVGEDGEMSISMNTRVTVDAGEEIKLGEEATEPAVLGDKLVTLLEDMIDAISTLTVPTAMGPSGVPINAATFTSLKTTIADIKSQLVKVE